MQPENEPGGQERRSFIEEARRAQIVSATIETIAEIGYAKASFVQIARRAGISPGLITYHFVKREELMKQVMLTVHTSIDQALGARAEGAESYAAALRALIEGFVFYAAERPKEMIAIGQIAAASRDAEAARSWFEEQNAKTLAELEDMFREGQREGELREFSPRVMAVSVLAAMEAAPAELMARPDTGVAVYARELADLFEHAMRRPASEATSS
ncbi:TetR family transcriptional regulator [Amycolatopsis roodepoortensis]|uniref:AcrR family transcriptional regulator n=1 Tax=Amycolatopsis roodepoortensis TaxID=700274 RepID=A0ABR9LB67_9PSEU|nr:TetR/AcrR family transcriptional regulator [Amycolatopsis roodepoortensis]MBE1577408.1 AcrR family transcriptional regulator [Amycolatopsis roodepoortensis]